MSKIISKQLILGKIVEDKQVSSSSINVKSNATVEDLKSVGESIKTLLNGEYDLNSKTIFSLDGSKGEEPPIEQLPTPVPPAQEPSTPQPNPPVEDIKPPAPIIPDEEDTTDVIGEASDWKYTVQSGFGACLTKFLGDVEDDTLIIPNKIRVSDETILNVAMVGTYSTSYSTVGILTYADNKEKIKKVIISEGVERLGGKAFEDCTYIEEVILPNSVVSMGVNAFYNANKLRKITLGKDLKVINNYCFYGCSRLSEINLENITKINTEAFSRCVSLQSYSIENSKVESIGSQAFLYCSFNKVILPKTLTNIDESAFTSCHNLKQLYYKNEGLKESLEENYSNLNPIYDADATSSRYEDVIGSYKDWNFVLQNGYGLCLTKFLGDVEEDTLIVPNKIRLIDGAILNVATVGNYSTSYSTTGILTYADNRAKVKKVIISSGAIRLGYRVFNECTYIEEVVVPNSINIVDTPRETFQGATRLQKVYVEPVNDKVFNSLYAEYTNKVVHEMPSNDEEAI